MVSTAEQIGERDDSVIWKGEQRKFLNLKEGRIRIKDEIK
jgi:hypothetical protein